MENTGVLQQRGPTPVEDLPSPVTVEDKQAGVYVFTLSGSRGAGLGIGGGTNDIAYLDSHSKKAVLRQFLDDNPRLIQANNPRGVPQLIAQHGSNWGDAAREILDEYYELDGELDFNPDPDDIFRGETAACHFCGQDVVKSKIPEHISESCDGS